MSKAALVKLTLPTRWVNDQSEGIFDKLPMIREAKQRGVVVVNGPRPLGGDAAWEDRFVTGIHYAAGGPEFYGHWNDYAHAEIKLISNRDVLQAVIDHSKTRRFGSTLRATLDKRGVALLKETAAVWLNMPYLDLGKERFEADMKAVSWE